MLAIIPARGGSKGIPRKNLREVAGVPLVAYSIVHALRTPSVDRVVVSTDDAEIEAVALEYGAEVVRRPAEISGDTATSESALVHALDTLRERDNYEPDLVVFLQATSPVRKSGAIQEAIDQLRAAEADSLFSANVVHGFVWRDDRGALESVTYDYRDRRRRQDAPVDLVENGSIYVFRPWVLRETNNRLGGKIVTYRMDAIEGFQVDEPGDIELMETIIRTAPETYGITDAAAPDWSAVDLLVLDFDGVMTDNRVLVSTDGTEAVVCHRGDGWGIARLRDAGLEMLVLSTEVNEVVAARCRKLSLPCIHACDDKLSTLEQLAAERGLDAAKIAYVGNDANDLDCLRWVGLPIVVADAEAEVLGAARYVTARPGGRGAVREVAERLLAARR